MKIHLKQNVKDFKYRKNVTKQNSRRNTNEPIDINKKIGEQVKKLIPEDIRKTEFARCMLKKTRNTTNKNVN